MFAISWLTSRGRSKPSPPERAIVTTAVSPKAVTLESKSSEYLSCVGSGSDQSALNIPTSGRSAR